MPETADRLPDGSILLHIGPHKTGTTAIQGALAASRQDMAQHGVTYVGRTPAHHAAARSLRRHPVGWVGDAEALPDLEVWRRFARMVNQTPGRVVASSEFFAQCGVDERATVADDLDSERLHLLVAARNPGSIAISTWQQVLRNGTAGGLDEWLEHDFRRPTPTRAATGFWSWADSATLVEAWSEVLPLDRIHVVVIKESDKTLLPKTFETLLGLPDGMLAARTSLSSNRGLTAPEAEVLREVIALTKDQLSWADFSQLMRMGFARHMLDERTPPDTEPRPVLPIWAAEQASVEADGMITRLTTSGASIIGDLENLRTVPPSGSGADISEVPTELAAHAVAGVVNGAVRGLARARQDAPGADKTEPSSAQPLRPRARTRSVDDIPTRELAGILRTRVQAAIARRLTARAR